MVESQQPTRATHVNFGARPPVDTDATQTNDPLCPSSSRQTTRIRSESSLGRRLHVAAMTREPAFATGISQQSVMTSLRGRVRWRVCTPTTSLARCDITVGMLFGRSGHPTAGRTPPRRLSPTLFPRLPGGSRAGCIARPPHPQQSPDMQSVCLRCTFIKHTHTRVAPPPVGLGWEAMEHQTATPRLSQHTHMPSPTSKPHMPWAVRTSRLA